MKVARVCLQPISPAEFRLVLEGQDGEQVVAVLSHAQVRELAQAATDATFAAAGAVSWLQEAGGGWA